MIYLASTSPRRRAMLRRLGLRFRVVKTRYRELPRQTGSPVALAVWHARGKAFGAAVRAKAGTVLGVDTVIYFQGKIRGKPKNFRDAFRMLRAFSGKTHSVYTAVALRNLKTGRTVTRWSRSCVTFRALSNRAIRRYLARVFPLDKAGGYAIQDSRDLVLSVQGSFTNVMGLPVEVLRRMIRIPALLSPGRREPWTWPAREVPGR